MCPSSEFSQACGMHSQGCPLIVLATKDGTTMLQFLARLEKLGKNFQTKIYKVRSEEWGKLDFGSKMGNQGLG